MSCHHCTARNNFFFKKHPSSHTLVPSLPARINASYNNCFFAAYLYLLPTRSLPFPSFFLFFFLNHLSFSAISTSSSWPRSFFFYCMSCLLLRILSLKLTLTDRPLFLPRINCSSSIAKLGGCTSFLPPPSPAHRTPPLHLAPTSSSQVYIYIYIYMHYIEFIYIYIYVLNF